MKKIFEKTTCFSRTFYKTKIILNALLTFKESFLFFSSVNLKLVPQDLSCFDTPLSSETSDLDETSSDLEAEAETIKSKVNTIADLMVNFRGLLIKTTKDYFLNFRTQIEK